MYCKAWLTLALLAGCSGFRPVDAVHGPVGSPFTIVRNDPTAGALRAVGGAGNVLAAAGDDGLLLDFDGTTWRPVLTGDGVDLNAVWAGGPEEIYAVGKARAGKAGVIFHKSPAGWVEETQVEAGLLAVWGDGPRHRFAAGREGRLYERNAGEWRNTFQFDPNPKIPLTDFAPLLWSLGGNNEKQLMAAGDVDTTYFFDGTWHLYTDPIDRTRTFRAIWGPPGEELAIYEGANYFGLWLFTGKDNPVLQLNEEKEGGDRFDKFIWSIWGPSSRMVVAVGDEGRIMTYDRESGAVRRVPSPTTVSLYGVWGTSMSDIWIVGENAIVLHGSIQLPLGD